MILDQATQGVSGRSRDVLVIRIGQLKRFHSRNLVLGEMHVHLVTVEVGVVSVAVGVMHADRLLAWQHSDSVTHDGGLVECRLPVHENHVAVRQMPMDLLVAQAAEVVSGRRKKLVCQRDTVLERLGSQVDDLAVLVFDGCSTRPLV